MGLLRVWVLSYVDHLGTMSAARPEAFPRKVTRVVPQHTPSNGPLTL